MKKLKHILSAAAALSVLSACQVSKSDALSSEIEAEPDYVYDENGGYTDENGWYHPPKPDYDLEEMERMRQEGWDKLEEQEAKYGPLLPLEYEDWMPEGTYGIISDIGYMISYMTYGVTADDAKRDFDIYIDRDGNRHITFASLNTEKAEIVFEDGTPASEDDLTPGTAVFVQDETVLETFPGTMICDKIIILQ